MAFPPVAARGDGGVTRSESESAWTGLCERIVFEAEDTGFVVAKMTPLGSEETVQAVGVLKGVTPGEMVEVHGHWEENPKWGRQFRVASYRSRLPESMQGIQQFLSSSRVRGVGKKTALRIVQQFGEETFRVLEETPERLQEIEGIGKRKAEQVAGEWRKAKALRDVMIFLQGHGLSSGLAARIYETYGAEAATIARQDPYRLSLEMRGVGFHTADKIALAMGMDRDSASRCQAGTMHVLRQALDAGHACIPYRELINEARKLLDVDRDACVRAVAEAFEEERIAIEDWGGEGDALIPNDKAVYLKPFQMAEKGLADRLLKMASLPGKIRPIHGDKAVAWVEERMGLSLSQEQREAINALSTSKVLLVSGGPGTGKTTLIRAMVEVLEGLKLTTALAAPTGRAAKRLSEATGREAKTLHRLLEYSFRKGFARGLGRPLDAEVLIVDESSMIDLPLMYNTVKAMDEAATLICVGDVDQLPSVGPGAVLRDLIDSGRFQVVWLETIFRQALQSRIVRNAHRVNQGQFPILRDEDGLDDFFFIEEEDQEKSAELVVSLVKDRIPAKYGYDPRRDIQVLTPMHKGTLGARSLNEGLREALGKAHPQSQVGERRFQVGDKVMQTRNDYDRDVFNGDVGIVSSVDREEGQVWVDFDGRRVEYVASNLDELVLAYAISIHKSQGSEYPAVVAAIASQHAVLLQRNLLYTAITRGKELVVIVGTRKALGMAVRNDKPARRYSRLKWRLCCTMDRTPGSLYPVTEDLQGNSHGI